MRKRQKDLRVPVFIILLVWVSLIAISGAEAAGDGTAWSWGGNSYGQLGDGTNIGRSTPAQVTNPTDPTGFLTDLTSVAAGGNHSLALKSDGTVWMWGDGSATPVQVPGLTNIIAVAGGDLHSLALESDGIVWAWGNNIWGQLGDGTTISSSSPVKVVELSDVMAVAAGGAHSLALKSDGSVYAWGDNFYGQLGDGTRISSFSPIKVSKLTHIVAVAAGGEHSLAVKANGKVYAWGGNESGQLGDKTTIYKTTPVKVSELPHSVISVAAGWRHSLALLSDGTMWAWGRNRFGQLGNGMNFGNSNIPVKVIDPGDSSGLLTDVIAISAGTEHSLAVKANGTVRAWGYNGDGQLGDGTVVERDTPVEVIDNSDPTGFITDMTSVVAGSYHSIGYKP